MAADTQAERVRLDRWLWAARFFKTRSLATAAVAGGRVHVGGGGRVRPSRPVKVGDRLTITRGTTEWTVVVRAIGDRRGPASEAAKLYEETAQSSAAREAAAARRKAERPADMLVAGRPTKRDRRLLERLRRRRGL